MDLALLMYLVGFLDLFGVSLVVPLINKHALELGASPSAAGLLGSVYGGLQLFSSPMVGKWSDISGCRHVLLWCLLLSAGSYAALGISTTFFILVLARIPAGLFKHSQGTARAYLADMYPKEEQSTVFGRFNAASSVGFIVGPAIGGHIADLKGGFYIAAALTTSVFLLTNVLVWWFVPEQKLKDNDQKKRISSSSINPLEFLEMLKNVDWHQLWDIFLIRFLMGIAVLVYRSNFLVMITSKYNTSSKMAGYLMSFNGIVGTISGLFVGKISSYYNNDSKLLFHSAVVQTIAIICLATAPSFWIFAVCISPLGLVNAVARVASTKVTVARGHGHDIGTLLGLGASITSLARMLSPTLAGVAHEFSISGPAIIGACFALSTVLFMIIVPQDNTSKLLKQKLT